MGRDDAEEFLVLNITSKTPSEMTLTTGVSHNYTVPRYLGAILSNDRTTVYWVNNTAPLP